MTGHAPRRFGIDRALASAAFVLGFATIAGALAMEHIGGLYPCPLCLTQRWPYYIGLPLLAALILFWRRLTAPLRIGLLLAAGGLFLWGAGLGVYHSGVEWGFWPGPQSCAGVGDEIVSLDMLADLSGVRVVACDAVQWEMFGLSLAGFNALISAGIVIALAIALREQARAAR